MRPALFVAILALLPACASPGRTTTTGHDAHVVAVDGGSIDTGAPVHDAGPTPDTGSTTPDMGALAVDTGPAPHDSGPIMLHDAYAPDTGNDSGCTSAAQCSDGIGCNGVERCESGLCVAGTAVTCDDGLSCTTDACVEPGMCQYTSTCAGGAACGATGCASSCSESPCRLLSPQCGCPTGQACYPTGATRACSTTGTGNPGATCTSNANCSATNMCLNVSTGATAAQVCTHMCTTDSECGGGLCILQLDDGTGTAVTGFELCTHPCNPVTGTGCPTGTECNLFQESAGAMRSFTDCTAPIGTGGNNATCTGDEDCRAGYLCIDPAGGTATRCHRWCSPPSSSVCPSGQTCYDFTDPVVVNGVEFGVCA